MRLVGVLLLSLACACSTTKVLQRDGCWVRSTKRLGNVREEIGPCSRPAPQWSQDRLTRLTQECMAAEESRWMSRAVVAWGRGEPLPPRASDEQLMKQCIFEPAKMVDESEAKRARLDAEAQKTKLEGDLLKAKLEGESELVKAKLEGEAEKARLEGQGRAAEAKLEAEHEATAAQLAQLAADRDALRQQSEEDRKHIRDSADRLADFLGGAARSSADALGQAAAKSADALGQTAAKSADALGEAAKKSSQPAVATATATSDGRAGTDLTSSSTHEDSTAIPAFAPAVAPGVAAAPAAPAAAGPTLVCATEAPDAKASLAALRRSKLPRKAKVAARAKPAPECDPAKASTAVQANPETPKPTPAAATGLAEAANAAPHVEATAAPEPTKPPTP